MIRCVGFDTEFVPYFLGGADGGGVFAMRLTFCFEGSFFVGWGCDGVAVAVFLRVWFGVVEFTLLGIKLAFVVVRFGLGIGG